ncbi:hypothetical protein ACH4U7_22590 [Streptomyces sp. NPDC020845]|uniref:hypothetical protein n=1 Tax=Streptomyces sp. NPDC020845 TaxID=3365096 RepID=UPI0037BDB750
MFQAHRGGAGARRSVLRRDAHLSVSLAAAEDKLAAICAVPAVTAWDAAGPPSVLTSSTFTPAWSTSGGPTWPGGELIMRNMLAGEERTAYEAHASRGRRQRLLGRIAVKDAVRRRLWAAGSGGIVPAEVRVSGDPAGRPYVTGAYGRTLLDLHVSCAHRAEVAVAIARTGPCGIDTSAPRTRTRAGRS